MRIKKDISDLSKFIDGIQGEVVDFMDEKAREAVKLQQVKANYRNHTWNLRSSLGYVVTYDGKEKRRYISGMNYGDEAVEAIKKWLDEVNKSGTSIVFADGMFYASFVSSKGYDVLDTAQSYLVKALNGRE